MQGFRHPGRIGKTLLVPDHATPIAVPFAAPNSASPVLPVLHDVIEGEALRPKATHDIEQLRLGLIALFAHKQAESRLGKHRGRASQLAISGDDSIHIVTTHEIVIDPRGRTLGPEGRAGRVILEDGFGVDVPENPIATRRHQERNNAADIGLDQQHLLPAIVHVRAIILSQSVEGLIRRKREGLTDFVARRAGNVHFPQIVSPGSAFTRDLPSLGR